VVLFTVMPVMVTWYRAHDVRCRTVRVKKFWQNHDFWTVSV